MLVRICAVDREKRKKQQTLPYRASSISARICAACQPVLETEIALYTPWLPSDDLFAQVRLFILAILFHFKRQNDILSRFYAKFHNNYLFVEDFIWEWTVYFQTRVARKLAPKFHHQANAHWSVPYTWVRFLGQIWNTWPNTVII